MSVTAAAILLGLLVVAMVKTRWLRFSGALVCVAFGIALAASPIGPAVGTALGQVGTWLYAQLQAV
ncbi:MAG TPA: hypothetical protein VFJ19_19755 [Nocardioidaceae bacterium]|nr:hypothetical protein [Nocardioidaceae bacterium]